MWLPLTSRTCADGLQPQQVLGDVRHPRAGRVDQRARGDGLALAARIEHELPVLPSRSARTQLGARADDGAALGRIDAR